VCAACDGGGCDTCERSGGVTLRERGAPADMLEVVLPQAKPDETFVIRLPERGGLAPEGSGLPRGHLLLRVEPSIEADASVTLALRGEKAPTRRVPSVPPVWMPPRALVLALVLGASVILLVIWLLFGR
jgi:hypothetical protein